MKRHSSIIAGGGWVTVEFQVKKQARWLAVLSIGWLPLSTCASFPFWEGWPATFGGVEWLCSSLLSLQVVFVVAALVTGAIEKPATGFEQRRDPNYDLRKLY